MRCLLAMGKAMRGGSHFEGKRLGILAQQLGERALIRSAVMRTYRPSVAIMFSSASGRAVASVTSSPTACSSRAFSHLSESDWGFPRWGKS